MRRLDNYILEKLHLTQKQANDNKSFDNKVALHKIIKDGDEAFDVIKAECDKRGLLYDQEEYGKYMLWVHKLQDKIYPAIVFMYGDEKNIIRTLSEYHFRYTDTAITINYGRDEGEAEIIPIHYLLKNDESKDLDVDIKGNWPRDLLATRYNIICILNELEKER